MTGWTNYALAMSFFVASHFLPRIGGLRERLIGAVGRRIYFSAYGMLSLALLAWIIIAAAGAPYVEIWPQIPWTRWLPNLAMPVAVILATCGAGLAQPFTLGGRRTARFDPANPGFAAVSRHPVFLALALWASVHLLPNGDLAHVILFGSFVVMALVAIPAFDAKARGALGPEADSFFASTAILSLAPLLRGPWLRANGRALAIRTALALLLWMVLLGLHTAVIGVSPFPV
ncbi:MAG: NnrU family protein [Pseudodonghicola sp.]|nr:NnrU family protein [Pseudodonghicola sp.]